MGHNLHAIILKGTFNREKAVNQFKLKPITLDQELTMFPLIAHYLDEMSERFDIWGHRATKPLYNAKIIHYIIREIAKEPLFAIIQTDYFGGAGTQHAGVYHGEREILDPTKSTSSINKALQQLGVKKGIDLDEFETIGLQQYRDVYDFFEDDHDV